MLNVYFYLQNVKLLLFFFFKYKMNIKMIQQRECGKTGGLLAVRFIFTRCSERIV